MFTVAAPPHMNRMNISSSWEGCALPDPPAGGGTGKPGFPIPCVRARPSRGRGCGETRFPHTPRRGPMFTVAAPPHTNRMRTGSSWEGCALPNPPAGGGVGKPGFPLPLLQQPMFTLARSGTSRHVLDSARDSDPVLGTETHVIGDRPAPEPGIRGLYHTLTLHRGCIVGPKDWLRRCFGHSGPGFVAGAGSVPYAVCRVPSFTPSPPSVDRDRRLSRYSETPGIAATISMSARRASQAIRPLTRCPCGSAAQRRNEHTVVPGRAVPSHTLPQAGGWGNPVSPSPCLRARRGQSAARRTPHLPIPLRAGQALPRAGAWGNLVSPHPAPRAYVHVRARFRGYYYDVRDGGKRVSDTPACWLALRHWKALYPTTLAPGRKRRLDPGGLRPPKPSRGWGMGKPGFPISLRGGGVGKPGFPTPLSSRAYVHVSPPCGSAAHRRDEHRLFLGGLRPSKPSRGRGRGETRFPHTLSSESLCSR